MTDSLLSRSETKSNRLDPPHDMLVAIKDEEPNTPWLALAGRDPSVSSDQLDRQTSELLAYVQQQNDEIDQRQADLNAKLAQLDNELRTARLRTGLDIGEELIPAGREEPETSGVRLDNGVELGQVPASKMLEPDSTAITPKTATNPQPTPEHKPAEFQEFEEVERLVAQITEVADNSARSTLAETPAIASVELAGESALVNQRLDDEMVKIAKQTRVRADAAHLRTDSTDGEIAEQAESGVRKPTVEHPKATIPNVAIHSDANMSPTADASLQTESFPAMLSSHLGRRNPDVDIQDMASSLEASELESERRMLTERKLELDRRRAVVQRMQDDAQVLHRESLEMRLVTEQLWIEISQKAPEEHVNQLVAELRSRLDQHYMQQQMAMGDRKTELDDLKNLIERKQGELREQSTQLQDWVEARHDEIKSYSAEVDAREMLLDRREHRIREEHSKWEATRAAYQTQLTDLMQRLEIPA